MGVNKIGRTTNAIFEEVIETLKRVIFLLSDEFAEFQDKINCYASVRIKHLKPEIARRYMKEERGFDWLHYWQDIPDIDKPDFHELPSINLSETDIWFSVIIYKTVKCDKLIP